MSTREMIDFITGISFEKLPGEVVAAAKIPILDCLGVTIGGSVEEASIIIDGYLTETGGKPEAGVIGGGFKTSASEAAWANGTKGHILDFDDFFLPYHPTVAILPAVLATAEKYGLSGKDVLLSYITGFEIQASLAMIMGRYHYEHGWHSTSVMGTLGAAAAVAQMLQLDGNKTRIALGIAGSLAAGLRRNFGSMTKPLHAGNAARNGVVAAMLAQKGFTADNDILEGLGGYLEVLGCNGKLSVSEMGKELGQSYYLTSIGVSIKPYPSCAGTHWAINGALDMRSAHEIDTDEIAEIECRTDSGLPEILIHHRPRKGLEGKFSLEYCIATALMDGEVRLKHFTDERVQAPAIQGLIGKVKYVHPPEMGTGPGGFAYEMLIKLKDGRVYQRAVTAGKGTPGNPLSREELNQKFKDCVQRCLSPADTESILEQISEIESIDNISKLMRRITFLDK